MLKDFKKAGGTGKVIRQERRSTGALLPSARPEMRIHEIPLRNLQPNSLQPRRYFSDESLQSLADSMKARGLKQPIVVRPLPDSEDFVVIAGERRWRAAELCGWEKIRAIWSQEEDNGLDGLLENVQRQDLLPLEIADHMVRLRDEQGIPMRDIAAIAGYREDEASRLTKVASLPSSIRDDYFTSSEARKVPAGALYEVAMASDPEMQGMMWQQAKSGASIASLRALRKAVSHSAAMPTVQKPGPTAKKAVSQLKKVIEQFEAADADFSQTLDLDAKKELSSLYDRLGRILQHYPLD